MKREPSDDTDSGPDNPAKNIKLETVQENAETKVSSPTETTTELFLLMNSISTNFGDFSVNLNLKDAELPIVSHLAIQGYGIVSVPITERIYESLALVDNRDPKCSAIFFSAKEVSFQNDSFSIKLLKLVENNVKTTMGLTGTDIVSELDGLYVFSGGYQFDNLHAGDSKVGEFGSLLIFLPSMIDAAEIKVNHCNNSKSFKINDPPTNILLAYYSGCIPKLAKLEGFNEGYIAVLKYNLCVVDTSAQKPSAFTSSMQSVKLCNLVNELMFTHGRSHLMWSLKKCDEENVLKCLEEFITYEENLLGKSKFYLFKGTAVMKVTEVGFCGENGYDDSEDDSYSERECRGGCGGAFDKVKKRDFEIRDINLINPSRYNISDLILKSLKLLKLTLNADNVIDNLDGIVQKNYKARAILKKYFECCSRVSGPCKDYVDEKEEYDEEMYTRNATYSLPVVVIFKIESMFDAQLLSDECQPMAVDYLYNLADNTQLIPYLQKLLEFKGELNIGPGDTDKVCDVVMRADVKDFVQIVIRLTKWEQLKCSPKIAKCISKYWSDDIKESLITSMKRCKDMQYIISLLSEIPPVTSEEIIVTLVSHIISSEEEKGNNNRGYYSSYSHTGKTLVEKVTMVLKFMDSSKTAPEKELGQLLGMLGNWSNICSAITMFVSHTVILNAAVARFTERAITDKFGEIYIKEIALMFLKLHKHKKFREIELMQAHVDVKDFVQIVMRLTEQKQNLQHKRSPMIAKCPIKKKKKKIDKCISHFWNDDIKESLIAKIMEESKDIKYIINLLSEIPLVTSEEIVVLVTSIVSSDYSRSIRIDNMFPGLNQFSYNYTDRDLFKKVAMVLKFMDSSKTTPEKELGQLLGMLESVDQNQIDYLVQNLSDDLKMDKNFLSPLIRKYVNLLPKIKTMWPHSFSRDIFIRLLKLPISSKNDEMAQTLVNGVIEFLNLPTTGKESLKELVAHLRKLSIPASYVSEIYKLRLKDMEMIIDKGRPVFSYMQPNAKVPGHLRVENFLRGPRPEFDYRNFNSLPDARKWISLCTFTGCSMNFKLGNGKGKAAFVTVTKTDEDYKRRLNVFDKLDNEYQTLKKLVYPNGVGDKSTDQLPLQHNRSSTVAVDLPQPSLIIPVLDSSSEPAQDIVVAGGEKCLSSTAIIKPAAVIKPSASAIPSTAFKQ